MHSLFRFTLYSFASALFLSLMAVSIPSAQAATFGSAEYLSTGVVGGTGYDQGSAVKTDSQGNLFVLSMFGTGTLDFNPGSGVDNYTNAGGSDVFLTKYNADGSYAWTKTWGGTGTDNAYDLDFDSHDNIYLAIEYSNTVDFDPSSAVDNHTSAGSVDIALVKLNADGTYGWTYAVGSTSHDRLHSVLLASDDTIYGVGKFNGTVDFDQSGAVDNHTSVGNYDAFFMKLNADGSYAWAKTWGGTDRDTVNDLTSDANGNIYLGGVFRNTANFDQTGGTDNQTSAGLDDAFVTKYNADGTYGWTRIWGSTNNDFSFNIGASPTGDVYVIGSFQGTVDFDPGVGTTSIASAGIEDSYINKLDTNGVYKLTYTTGGSVMDELNGISFDSNGNYYVTGFFGGTVDLDPTGGTDSIAPSGAFDQYFSAFNAQDAYLGSVTFGSATDVNWFDEIPYDIYASGSKVYVTGAYFGTTDFNPGTGVDSYTSAGGNDVFYSTYRMDLVGPVISSVAATPSSIITWVTDELSDSQIEYGSTSTYTSSTTLDTTMRTSHTVEVPGLAACSTYHYRVISKDAATHSSSSTDKTFIVYCAANSSSNRSKTKKEPDIVVKEVVTVPASATAAATPAALKATPKLVRDLAVGSTGEDVRQLQVFLNSNGFTVAATGPGSKGSETIKFGAATKAAVKAFQLSKGIRPALGYFGPKSRAAVK